jgi:DNA ligase-1
MVGQVEFQDFNKLMVTQGYEGIMIKDVDAPYECKRSTSWLKQKPFIEVSLEVTDVEEGTGRNIDKLGALVCSGVDDGKTIEVNVGSGFSDVNRDEFWLCRDTLPGQVVEVRADAITQNQDGTYSLRFPRFLRFRGFTKGEKI